MVSGDLSFLENTCACANLLFEKQDGGNTVGERQGIGYVESTYFVISQVKSKRFYSNVNF